jgi:hypothetical protein
MSAGKGLLELLRALPALIRAFRPSKPLPPAVKTEPLKPTSTYPAMTIIDRDGNRRDL